MNVQVEKYDALTVGDQAAHGRELVVLTTKGKIAVNLLSSVLTKKEDKIVTQTAEISGLRKQLDRRLNDAQLAAHMKNELDKVDPLANSKTIRSKILEELSLYLKEEERKSICRK